RKANGQLNGSRAGSERRRPRHLLSGIIQCGECGRRFVVGGNSSKYLFCPGYRRGVCNCKTKLPRQLAEQLILDAIGEQILASPVWTNAVVSAANHAWMNRDQDIPRQLECVRSRIQEVNRRCERLLDQIETGEVVDQLTRRFKQREKELQELRNQEAALTREVSESSEPPSEPWIRQRIADLGTTLRSTTPAAAEALRQLLVDSIVVNEVKREGRERHFLRATLSIRHTVIAQESSFAESTDEEFAPPSTVVTIDIVSHPDNRKGDEVRRLYDQGLPNKIIAEQLKISRASVTVLLKKSFDASGEEKPDGRKRRWALEGNWTNPPLFQRIADKVMGFYNEGMLLADIATKCEVDRNTVTKAIKFWNNSRELAVPDGRTRRKLLDAKQRNYNDEVHSME
ncbi:MAG: recombinase zinc beta ribbon domain-containing protein, partial [Planctomycetaceae bacterium]|nr:recombinase zinc beta ribbon domain-containing protein [Planctomycetaceae bacterium]